MLQESDWFQICRWSRVLCAAPPDRHPPPTPAPAVLEYAAVDLRSPVSARRIFDTLFGRDVEMVDILACAERLVQPDRRLVSTVGLNVNHVRLPLSCNPLQLSYQF